MKRIAFFISLLGIAAGRFATAQHTLDLETGRVIADRMDVAIPGDTGSRLSLTDDLKAEDTVSFRLRYGYSFAQNHWLGVLAAPLTVESKGVLNREIDFNGTVFPAGTAVDSTFRFDSYRLIYRYLVHESDRWEFRFGAALKVRDAAIRLEGGGWKSQKNNTGLVPLLSFHLAWKPSENWRVILDGEALAASLGRAEDALLAAQYRVHPR
ncbi:MAG: hypothetical protein U1E27_03540, partial [Kiritimatiellia bacterium]|nr:hypothetical protein [Kiritimatiellia bacterium]